jgi:hypothetical protein
LQGITLDQWTRLFDGISGTDLVEELSAANCDITDSVGMLIAKCIEENKSVKILTLDSNSLSGKN